MIQLDAKRFWIEFTGMLRHAVEVHHLDQLFAVPAEDQVYRSPLLDVLKRGNCPCDRLTFGGMDDQIFVFDLARFYIRAGHKAKCVPILNRI